LERNSTLKKGKIQTETSSERKQNKEINKANSMGTAREIIKYIFTMIK